MAYAAHFPIMHFTLENVQPYQAPDVAYDSIRIHWQNKRDLDHQTSFNFV